MSQTNLNPLEIEPVYIQKEMSKEDKEALTVSARLNESLYELTQNQKREKTFSKLLIGTSIALGGLTLWEAYSDPKNDDFNISALAATTIGVNLAGTALRRKLMSEKVETIRETTAGFNAPQYTKTTRKMAENVQSANGNPAFPILSQGFHAPEMRLNFLQTISTIIMASSPVVGSLSGVLVGGSLAAFASFSKDVRVRRCASRMKKHLGRAMPKVITNPYKKSIGDERGER